MPHTPCFLDGSPQVYRGLAGNSRRGRVGRAVGASGNTLPRKRSAPSRGGHPQTPHPRCSLLSPAAPPLSPPAAAGGRMRDRRKSRARGPPTPPCRPVRNTNWLGDGASQSQSTTRTAPRPTPPPPKIRVAPPGGRRHSVGGPPIPTHSLVGSSAVRRGGAAARVAPRPRPRAGARTRRPPPPVTVATAAAPARLPPARPPAARHRSRRSRTRAGVLPRSSRTLPVSAACALCPCHRGGGRGGGPVQVAAAASAGGVRV